MFFRRESYNYPKPPFKKGKITCPVCGRTHHYHCSVTVDESLALCKYVPSDKVAEDGRYVHALRPFVNRVSAGVPPQTVKSDTAECAEDDRLNAVYFALLSELELDAAHGDELLIRRGLSDTTIAYNLYASVPD